MAKIFISHSSADKDFVRKLAADLRQLGHQPWLDEWEIRIGDSIVTKVGSGIRECDFVAIALSTNSVSSPWVEREWEAKYWAEIQTNQKMVLPLLIEDCEIPSLLAPKKYADFRQNYAVGLAELASALTPTSMVGTTNLVLSASDRETGISA